MDFTLYRTSNGITGMVLAVSPLTSASTYRSDLELPLNHKEASNAHKRMAII